MAQGPMKKSAGKAHADKSRHRPEKPKPKKVGVMKHEKLKKKMASQRNATVEKIMATRAAAVGKLSIMKNAADSSTTSSSSSTNKGSKKHRSKKK